MKFNVDKCAVTHIEHNNINGNYTMTNQQLPVTEQQRDLGFIITKDLSKWQQQAEKSCKTINRVLGFIARNFKYKNREMMLPLYKSLVRPHLEDAVQFWSPHLRRDIFKMEKIQRKASKMIPEMIKTLYGLGELISSVKYKLLVHQKYKPQRFNASLWLNALVQLC